MNRRFWRPSALPGAFTTCVFQPVPRAGVEPDLCGLKDRRSHRKSNEAYQIRTTKKANRPGVASYPRPARLPLLARQGFIRSYPVRSSRFPHLTSYPDAIQDRSQADPYTGPRDRPSSRQRQWPLLGEVQCSCARGSWLYRVYAVYRCVKGGGASCPLAVYA